MLQFGHQDKNAFRRKLNKQNVLYNIWVYSLLLIKAYENTLLGPSQLIFESV